VKQNANTFTEDIKPPTKVTIEDISEVCEEDSFYSNKGETTPQNGGVSLKLADKVSTKPAEIKNIATISEIKKPNGPVQLFSGMCESVENKSENEENETFKKLAENATRLKITSIGLELLQKTSAEESAESSPTFCIGNEAGEEIGDAYVELPCQQAQNGRFTLMVDSGSDTSLLRRESIKKDVELNKQDTKWLVGAFGGKSSTIGSLRVAHTTNENLKFKMHVVEKSRLPADGVLGRDILWNYTFTDAVNKFLIFHYKGVHIASLPMKLVEPSGNISQVCVANELTIRPRAIQIIPIKIQIKDTDVVVHKFELKPQVFVGETLTRIKNGIGYVPIMNITSLPVRVGPAMTIPYSLAEEFEEVTQADTIPNILLARTENEEERIAQIMKLVALEDKLSERERESMISIFRDFNDVFQLNGDELTYTDVLQHEIPTDPTRPPVNVKQYRLPVAHRTEINRQVDSMLQQGIIKPSNSPWNSPIILVDKKPGPNGKKKWRLVVDFKKVNEQTIKQVFPIPRIDEILDQLGFSRYFTTLDLASGYHQVLVDEKDQMKTAFSTGMGHFEYVRMPFGLTGAPATFQRIMNSILSGLQGTECFVYLDDIAIHARNLEEHEKRLRKVLQILRESKLKVQTEKCQFLKREVVYLGHVCSETGVKPDPAKVECVKKHAAPKNKKDLQAFLGLVNYYRKFIPNAAEILLPLTHLLKKNVKFVWSESCQNSMEKLKDIISSPPILQYPDFEKTFLLTTDASNGALGAILSQGEIGQDLPIAFASRALSDTERRYSTIEKEFLAIVWAAKSFRAYLLGRPFIVYTDHKPLVGVARLKDQTSRLARFHHKLSEFDFEIKYKPGKNNLNADALSRIPYEEKANVAVMTRAKAREMTERAAKEGGISEMEGGPIKKGPRTNTNESEAETQVHNKDPQTQEESDDDEERVEESDTDAETLKDSEAVLLTSEKDIKEVLRKFHDGPLGGHRGAKATVDRIKKQFRWPGMHRQIAEYIRSCRKCQKNKSGKVEKAPMVLTDTPRKPFEKIYMDVVGAVTLSARGNKHILTVQDAFSKYFICVAMPDQEAKTVAKAFFQEVICKFGIPKKLVTDNGTNFVSDLFKELCKMLGVKKIETSPYHPQANGGLERSHRPLAEFLRCVTNEDATNWDEWLHHAMHVYNNHPHAATKQSPMKTLYGFEVEVPTNIKRKTSPLYNPDDYTKVLKYQLQRMHELVRENQIKEKEKAKIYYDKKAKERIFSVGQKVLLRSQARKGKFSPIWEGPYEVVDLPTDVNVKIKIKNRVKVYHKNMVKPFISEKQSGSQVNVVQVKEKGYPGLQRTMDLIEELYTTGWNKIDIEYYKLNKCDPDSSLSVGNARENLKKNRYRRVVCCDESRVKIKHPNSSTDYINANYIDGFQQPRKFIAAQGPMTGTVVDFWRMVWQEGTEKIIMVTELWEKGFSKCYKYWPDAGKILDVEELEVTSVTTENFKTYQKTTLRLVNYETQEARYVCHWWFKEWKDQNVPNLDEFLLFRNQVNYPTAQKEDVSKVPPMVVHCSAGIGRAGTYIAFENSLSEFLCTGQVNIAAVVRRLRRQRAGCVTTGQQYRWLYKGIIKWASNGLQLTESGKNKLQKILSDQIMSHT